MIIFNAFQPATRYIYKARSYVNVSWYIKRYSNISVVDINDYYSFEVERLFEKLINQTMEQRHAYFRAL